MTLDDIDLTDNLVWQNEFAFSSVTQERERSLTGGLLIQEGVKQYGRPIILGPSWLDRATIDALVAKAATPSTLMTLTLDDGRTFTVIFDRAQGSGIDAVPVNPYTLASQEPTWQYQTTLRLLTVEPPAQPEV